MLLGEAVHRKGAGYGYGDNRHSMTERYQALDADADEGANELAGLQSLPLASIWSALTSQVGDAFATTVPSAQGLDSLTQLVTTDVTSSTSTATTDNARSSTVDLTTASTTTAVALPSSSISASTILATPSPGSTTSIPARSSTAGSSVLITSVFSQVTLAPATTQSPGLNSASLTIALESHKPLATSLTSVSKQQAAVRASHRRAVIAGLSALIATLFILGILACLFLRRRRRLKDSPIPLLDEKRSPEIIHHQCFTPPKRWNDEAARPESGTPAPPPQAHARTAPASVDEDHHIIRMNTHHWHRPFIKGCGEGIRDSTAPGLLRITNPDLSRPSTPDVFAGKKLIPTFATRLLHPPRSRTPSSLLEHRRSPPSIPDITLNPAVSRTCSTRSAYSIPSLVSLAVVQQHPPDDPFLTPPDDVPCDWPLPGPSPEPKRTLLRPFRMSTAYRSSVVRSARSSSTASSLLAPGSRYSDPFDLDRRSARSSLVRGSGGGPAGGKGQWQVYEGT